jgi:hypothetical protein
MIRETTASTGSWKNPYWMVALLVARIEDLQQITLIS